MLITTKLRGRKDCFVVTIYKEERQKLDLNIGNILIINVNNHELIRPLRKDFHICLPKNILEEKSAGDKIVLHILHICKKQLGAIRPQKAFKNNKIDIRHFIPKTTIFGHPIYIIKRNKEISSIWYPVGGGVRHITITNTIPAENLAELLGFYFGDGNKSFDIRSFRLTNCEPSILNHCLNTLEKIGISRNNFKIQIIYSTDKELTAEIKRRCINFWNSALRIRKNNIKSVLKAKNIRETLKCGSARIFFDNAILVEIFLHGLLKGLIPRIIEPKKNIDKKLMKGFFRGVLAAEGSPQLNKNGSVVRIGLSFNPHSNELELYKKLLQNLNIVYGMTKGNELLIHNHKNLSRIHELDGFGLHEKRNDKFIKGFKNHKKTVAMV